MRIKLIESDLVEAVVGLGKELFYNSPMEACVVICRSEKPEDRKNKTLLIHAVKDVHKERSQSFLKPENQARILKAYQAFTDEPGFTAVVGRDVLLANDGRLSIPLYIKTRTAGADNGDKPRLDDAWARYEAGSGPFWSEMDSLVELLNGVVAEGTSNA